VPEERPQDWKRPRKLTPVWRAVVEVGFIVFLYYSNLLMGEFETSGLGQRNGLLWAVRDIFTEANITIAIASALAGYLIIELFRKRL
jgi:hypothetical protein